MYFTLNMIEVQLGLPLYPNAKKAGLLAELPATSYCFCL